MVGNSENAAMEKVRNKANEVMYVILGIMAAGFTLLI